MVGGEDGPVWGVGGDLQISQTIFVARRCHTSDSNDIMWESTVNRGTWQLLYANMVASDA
jgi:hypothetical protein